MSKTQILICDDDSLFHLGLKQTLRDLFQVKSAYHGDEALAILRNHPVDLLLLDIQMRSVDEGLAYISRFLEVDPELSIVITSSRKDFRSVREAMRLGACDYISKDMELEELVYILNQVLERRNAYQQHLQQKNEVTRTQKQHLFVGESPVIQKLRRTIEKVKKSQANVLITGETGTGKELVARQLRNSRDDGSFVPFIAVDSSTIQGSTAESLLFGHEKGAFTGADRATKGVFEEAHQGIVYLDEIANMPLDIQAKLLRVIQEKEIARLGSTKVIPLEFRMICATNQDLEELSRLGKFKYDLFQRLNAIPIHVPPLRERTEDIPILLQYLTQKRSSSVKFTDASIDVLMKYSWPGNIRELNNVIDYVITLADGPCIEPQDLPVHVFKEMRTGTGSPPNRALGTSQKFYEKVSQFEKGILVEAYQKYSSNLSQLSVILGMDRSHLYKKLREYEIHPVSKGKVAPKGLEKENNSHSPSPSLDKKPT